ncbi:SRPBCC family protein [Ralstonia mannitolilytica]|uniref:Domain of uncharacterized function (DUF1857) n=3 Tax=Ralstonia TaxID=48736 RepID=A0A0D5AQ23_9RALS|nr:SRPBCC family protein [Ralstonia mannitolilytica]ATG20052.1 DUF1857 domain-containing protein [Ralstonia pickettii]AJW45174.1 hypothetical protein TK49_10960 [Ralstonia mannitolilytica]ANA34702.1 hypothetical protein VZ52_15615 [Ralstonia mannitolilytica]MBU9579147.1 DUF1857 family protein [Ralstonia mannitolilytica]MBY4719168.1 DUF1857 family protein [Ralstonia mannitolilytica]
MRFEHLVEVNDPLNPLIDALTPNQIWQGLVLRVREQKEFVESLDECIITAEGDGWVERELVYGRARIQDRVTLEPHTRVTYTTAATGEHAGGSLTMTIETGDNNAAFIRFVYDTTLPNADESGDTRYAEIVKSAYRESDIDTVRRIREIAATGRLG